MRWGMKWHWKATCLVLSALLSQVLFEVLCQSMHLSHAVCSSSGNTPNSSSIHTVPFLSFSCSKYPVWFRWWGLSWGTGCKDQAVSLCTYFPAHYGYVFVDTENSILLVLTWSVALITEQKPFCLADPVDFLLHFTNFSDKQKYPVFLHL